MKKKITSLRVLMVSIMVMVPSVSAATPYVTSLVLPDFSSVLGLYRSYATGDHIIDMSIDGWYSTCSANPNKIRIDLEEYNSSKTLASRIQNTYLYTSMRVSMGSFIGSSKRYYFTSRIDSEYYCGIRSDYVALYPKAN